MTYKQLTYEHRNELKAYLKLGIKLVSIAHLIGVHKSTISRELKRNSGLRGYRPNQAQQKANSRKKNSRKKTRFTQAVKQRVEFYIKQDWSPEQVSGRLALEEDIHISHETIYQHIWADKQAGGDLYTHLRGACKKKKKRYGKKDDRGQIKDCVRIANRPEVVDKKERIGDWEIDTIIGSHHKGALVSAVERKSQLTLIEYVPKKQADIVTKTIINMLKPFKSKVLTITVDNGKEFALHKNIAQELAAHVYFAHPYHSWERGLNENTNGLIRQYFPKKYDFRTITKQDTVFVENRLNNRPRKTLNFKKPIEIFFNNSVALGT
jgi:IS30 family transposase